MIRRPPRSTLAGSSAASDVYKRQVSGYTCSEGTLLTSRSVLGYVFGRNTVNLVTIWNGMRSRTPVQNQQTKDVSLVKFMVPSTLYLLACHVRVTVGNSGVFFPLCLCNVIWVLVLWAGSRGFSLDSLVFFPCLLGNIYSAHCQPSCLISWSLRLKPQQFKVQSL